jgi:hypothetical protein
MYKNINRFIKSLSDTSRAVRLVSHFGKYMPDVKRSVNGFADIYRLVFLKYLVVRNDLSESEQFAIIGF